MPRIPTAAVDEVWARVSEATGRGELGIGAKVSTLLNNALSPHNEDGLHVVCVYTADCRDLADVAHVLSRLRLLGITQRLSYKENGATYARVYGIGAALYVAQPGSSVIERRRDPIPTPLELIADAGATDIAD